CPFRRPSSSFFLSLILSLLRWSRRRPSPLATPPLSHARRPRRRPLLSPRPSSPAAPPPCAPLPRSAPALHRASRSRCCRRSSRLRAAAGARLPLPHTTCLPPPRLLRGARQGPSPTASSSGGFELRRAGEKAVAAAHRDHEDVAVVVDRYAGGSPRGRRGSPKRGAIFSSSPLRGSICLAARPAARRGQLFGSARPSSTGLARRIRLRQRQG
ncbi:unnamed protein product, partial [Urochloa humidicola]